MSDRTSYIVQNDTITIRLMQDDLQDYQLMEKWLTDEKVLEFYGGRDNPYPLEKLIKEYPPLARGEDPVRPCIVSYKNVNIGYLQYCSLTDLSSEER